MLDDLAALFREHPIEAGTNRLVILDGVIEQHVSRAPTLFLVAPFAEHRALYLGRNGRREGQRSDARNASFRILGAHKDSYLAGLLSLQRRGSAEIIIAGAVNDIGALTQHLLTGLRAFRAVRLRVGRYGAELPAKQTPLGVHVVDEHLRRLGAVV